MDYELLILGGGPAGASAALFAARAGLRTLVIDADKGPTRRAMLNNYLGFPEGITGPDLVEAGRAQATKAGATWVQATVEELRATDGGYLVKLEDGGEHTAARLLLAQGRSVKLAEALGVTTVPNADGKSSHIGTDREGRTNLPGVWAAGYGTGITMHALVTAGDGARVAINLISELRGVPLRDHDVMPAPEA